MQPFVLRDFLRLVKLIACVPAIRIKVCLPTQAICPYRDRCRRKNEGVYVLEIGTQAPDFELAAVTGDRRHKVRLSDYRGKKNVVLAFYPLDWTPT